jgi:hypothetical protein
MEIDRRATPLDYMLIIRCVLHMTSAALSIQTRTPFSELINTPEKYADGYLITMPADMLKDIAAAIGS